MATRWKVPGTAALNTGNYAQLTSVSCASAGNCAAGGFYTDSSGNLQAFLVSQTSGGWGAAMEVPGTAALNAVRIPSPAICVSCAATCIRGFAICASRSSRSSRSLAFAARSPAA